MFGRHLGVPLLAPALALAACALPAAATNGMYLIGYGPETVARGGANLAISDRTLALNFNPAGIAQLQGNHVAASLSTLAPSLQMENQANSPFDGADRYFPLPAVAYVRSGKDTRWSFGFGLVAQGGMGATFEDEATFFGTRDETFTEVRFATLTPTVAYSFSEDMAVGATLNVGYADASFRCFPDTSFFNPANPAMSFPGVNLKQAWGLQSNLRLGWWWRPQPRLTVGAVYQTETDSDSSERHATAGFSWLAGDKLVEFAVEHAFENSRTNDNPDPMVNPFGPGTRVAHQQWTVSMGVSWAWPRQR
jgi:long-chain fatty acid transport protein